MSVVRRIAIGENHKSATVLNRPTDDILTLSGLTLGETFTGFASWLGMGAGPVQSGEVGVTATGYAVGDVRRYGASTGGLIDATSAINNAITSVCALGGGVVFFPVGTFLILGQLTFPDDGVVAPFATQKTVRLIGCGSINIGARNSLYGATVFDMRSAAGPAHLYTTATGLLEIAGITFKDGTSSSLASPKPYIWTTWTTVHIHDCAFFGATDRKGVLSVQDAIQLGGFGLATGADVGTSNQAFGGYGSTVSNNFFQRIRATVTLGTSGNGVGIFDNQIGRDCGGTAAIISQGYDTASNLSAGTTINNNIIEVESYVYGIKLSNTQNTTMVGNQFWDPTVGVTLAGVRFESTATLNTLIGGYYFATVPFVSDASGGLNTVMDPVTRTISGLTGTSVNGTGAQTFEVHSTDFSDSSQWTILVGSGHTGGIRQKFGTRASANAYGQIGFYSSKFALDAQSSTMVVNTGTDFSLGTGTVPFASRMTAGHTVDGFQVWDSTNTAIFGVSPKSVIRNLPTTNGPVGTLTLGAASTTVVSNTAISASSIIHLTATNAAAATLMAGKGVYISARSAATSFTVATGDGTAAAGTETFNYRFDN